MSALRVTAEAADAHRRLGALRILSKNAAARYCETIDAEADQTTALVDRHLRHRCFILTLSAAPKMIRANGAPTNADKLK
jgi:hypothetical protein